MFLPSTFTKTRLAPTPSGFLHLGNILSFALTAGLANQQKADILLRIDDLDQGRVRKEYVEDIFDCLSFLEIPWHQGPRNFEEYEHTWSQVHRRHLYKEALDFLRDQNLVFACNCSRSQLAHLPAQQGYPGTCLHKNLALDLPGVNWRLNTSAATGLWVNTCKGQPDLFSLPPSMQFFVVRKKDGLPSYQLSSVIDDSHFGIDLVVRGVDLWPSTLAQIFLSTLLPGNRFAASAFYHHLLLKEKNGEKLSKSDGAISVRYHRLRGESAASVFASIGARLGCPGHQENWQQLFHECKALW